MDARRKNMMDIGKAARLMDIGDTENAQAILRSIIHVALTQDDPINYCEAQMFLADIALHAEDEEVALVHLEALMTVSDARVLDVQRRAKQMMAAAKGSEA